MLITTRKTTSRLLLLSKRLGIDNKLLQSTFSGFLVKKFNDVHVPREAIKQFCDITKSNLVTFEDTLKKSLDKWTQEKRSSVWLHLGIEHSHLATVLAKYGFCFHHAEESEAALFKWLDANRECKIPRYATHQMGVAGVAYRADTDQILVIKDRYMIKDVWKLPGGAVLGFRQQHNYPGAYGRSDLYVVCRLEPLTYEIQADLDEIKACAWLTLDQLEAKSDENKLMKHIVSLMRYGIKHGFEQIDIGVHELPSLFPGRVFRFFHRDVPI